MSKIHLSPEQRYAFDKFKAGENLFITGPGGTGKTRLIELFVEYAKSQNKQIQVCAMTGCASVLLNCGARTLHSWSGIKLAKGPNHKIIQDVQKSRQHSKNWRSTQILIVDEVSMMSHKIFEIIEEIAQNTRKSSAPFGGIQVIFTGDFFQLPPVGTPGDPATEMFCFESPKWSKIFPQNQCIELTTIFRQTDPLYKEILLQVRTATLTPENTEILKAQVNRTFDPEKYNGCYPTKLFPTRAKTDFLNKSMFERLDGNEYQFTIKTKTDCKMFLDSFKMLTPKEIAASESLSQQEIEYEIQLLMAGASYDEIQTLKIGAVVMCTVNLDMDRGICNGAQGKIIEMVETKDKMTGLSTTVPLVRFANGQTLPIHIHYRQSPDYPAIAVGQIPLILAWALTIHKIQGATLNMAEIDVGIQIFENGQTYVALSRVQSLDGLYLKAFQPQRIRADERARAFYKTIPKREYIKDEEPVTDFTKYAYNPEPIETTTKKIKL